MNKKKKINKYGYKPESNSGCIQLTELGRQMLSLLPEIPPDMLER